MSNGRSTKSGPVVLDTRVVTKTGGGPDKTILNSPRFLAPYGYQNLCAYMHPPGDPGFEQLRIKAAERQAPLLSVPDRGAWDWHVVAQLLHICRQKKVAIWHGHDYKSNALGVLLRRFWPMKLVTTVHGWGKHGPRTQLYYRIDRLCLRYYDSIICVSEDLQAKCLSAGVPANRCVVIENAIDTAEYLRRHSVTEAKRQAGYPEDRLLVGAVGRVSPEKGFDLLIRAIGDLVREGVDVGLYILGDGEETERMRQLVLELGLDQRVQLLGFRSNTLDLYEAMDVYALSSIREGLPNVLLEAMAMEVPVVATRIAGVPRVIQDETNGVLIEPSSVEALTSALRRLLTDDGLRARLRFAGRKTIEDRYSFRIRMDRIRGIYDDLLGRMTTVGTGMGISS